MTIEDIGGAFYTSEEIKEKRKPMTALNKFNKYLSKYSNEYKVFDGKKFLVGVILKNNYIYFLDYCKKKNCVTGFLKLNLFDNFLIDNKTITCNGKQVWVLQTEVNIEEYLLELFFNLDIKNNSKKTKF
tara:strand:- start:6054 stop:6440 length:387 start_codon:yes stop_codon:yes gene_type:complete